MSKQFKTVSASKLSYLSPAKLAEEGRTGLVLEGVYIGPVPNSQDAEKNDFKFETEDGSTVIVNGTGGLTRDLAAVAPGTLTQLIYNGKNEMKSGKNKGKMAHNFEVRIEEAN